MQNHAINQWVISKFYEKLIKVLAETLEEVNSSQLLESVIDRLANTEEIKGLARLAKT